MSLLSIIGKAFTRSELNKLQTLAERLYPEALCGFRAGRSTIDMIFSLRQLQEKCGEQRKHLHIALIDLTKAFDLVSRVCSLSCREWDATQAPKDDHVFPWKHARNRPVRRLGYVLAPTLFGIFFSLLLFYALSQSEDGVYLHTRSDGNLFNLARLRAKTKVRKVLLRDTLRVPYSDSSAPSHTLVACLVSPQVSRRPTSLANTSAAHQVSPWRLHSRSGGGRHSPRLHYFHQPLARHRTEKRIGKTTEALAHLGKRVWDNTMLTINTKMKVFQV